MLHLIPPSLHRVGYRVAHRLRRSWWQIRRPNLEGVAVIATNLNEQLLLVRHSYGSDAWNLPAGGLRRGETPESGAGRELFEETGCDAHNLQLVTVHENVLHGVSNRVHLFSARVSGHPTADMREVIDARFFPLHSLPEPLTQATRARLELYREASQQR